MANKALLVIDMQKDLCYDSRRKQHVIDMIPQLNRTINLFEMHGHHVIYICFSLPIDDEQFARFGDRYCIEGTEGAEIITELLPLKGQVIKKKKHSAFFETELDDTLRELGTSEIYLTGLQTQICIMTTAADASFRGYKVTALSDCVVSTRKEDKDYALKWITKYVGDVRTSTDVAEDL